MRKFQFYYDKAKEELTKARSTKSQKDFGIALLDFQQLLVFKQNVDEINSFISECKRALDFAKRELTDQDKNYAINLVNKSKKSYQDNNFQAALNSVNEALKVWDEVPDGRNTRLALSELTKDNELKYRMAEKAYGDNDFDTAFKLTSEIMKEKGQDIDKVIKLNRKAEIKKQS